MQVETYECLETASEPIEATEEAIAIMQEYGMGGQIELVTKDTNGNDQRCPYREMQPDEFFTFKALCPKVFTLKDYNRSPMPLRVLQVLKHAQSLSLFNRIVVWDKESATVEDPVLVGELGEHEWSSKKYILARWGEVLDTFSVMRSKAIEAVRAMHISKAKEANRKAKMRISEVEEMDDIEVISSLNPTSFPQFHR